MTDKPQDTAPYTGPNLMILKGVVWGLGVLLLLGFGLIAVMIARGPQEDDRPGTKIAFHLTEGDRIVSSTLEEGRLIATIERGGMPHRIVIIDMRTNQTFEIPVEYTAP